MAITDLPNFNRDCLNPLPTKTDFKLVYEIASFLEGDDPCDEDLPIRIDQRAKLAWRNEVIQINDLASDETKSIEVLKGLPVTVTYRSGFVCNDKLKDQGSCTKKTSSCGAYDQFVKDAFCSSMSAVVPDVQNPNRQCGCIEGGQQVGEHCHQCECPDCDRSKPIPDQLNDPKCGRSSLIENPRDIAESVGRAPQTLEIINNHIDRTELQQKQCPQNDKRELTFKPKTITLTIIGELELFCVKKGKKTVIATEPIRVSKRFRAFEEDKEEFDCLLDVKRIKHLNVDREDGVAECLYREGNICRFAQKTGAIEEKSLDNFKWCCPTVYYSRCYGWEYYMPRTMNEGLEVWWDQRKIITLQQLFGNTGSQITIGDLHCLAEANVVDERMGNEGRTHYRLYCNSPCTDGEIKEYLANNVPTLFRKFKNKLENYHDDLENVVGDLVALYDKQYQYKKKKLEEKKLEGCPCGVGVSLGGVPEMIVSAPGLN